MAEIRFLYGRERCYVKLESTVEYALCFTHCGLYTVPCKSGDISRFSLFSTNELTMKKYAMKMTGSIFQNQSSGEIKVVLKSVPLDVSMIEK